MPAMTNPVVYQGTLYWVSGMVNGTHIWRLGFHDFKPRMIGPGSPLGQLAAFKDGMGLVERDTQFWLAPNPEDAFRQLPTEQPYTDGRKHFYQENP